MAADGKQTAQESVWIGVIVYPPEHPPRHPKVAFVFAEEAAAVAWRDEGEAPNRAMTTTYRRIEHHKVVR